MCVQSDSTGGQPFIKGVFDEAVRKAERQTRAERAEPELDLDAFAKAYNKTFALVEPGLTVDQVECLKLMLISYLRQTAPKPFVPGHYSVRWAHGFEDIHHFATDAEWPEIRKNGHVIGERVEPKF